MSTHLNILAVSSDEVENAFRAYIAECGDRLMDFGLYMACHILWPGEDDEVMKRLPCGSWTVCTPCYQEPSKRGAWFASSCAVDQAGADAAG